MRTITFFILFFYFNTCYEVLAQSISNDSISMFVNDSLNNEELITKTRIYLIKKGFKPLSCQGSSCASHLWKKHTNKKYSNAHQIGQTPYFFKSVDFSNIVANKRATTYAKRFSELAYSKLDSLDTDNDFIITNSDIVKYNRVLRENK